MFFVPQSRPPRPTPEKREKKVREKIAHPDRWGRLITIFFYKKQQHEIEFQGDCGRQADDVQTSKTAFPSSGKKEREKKKGEKKRKSTATKNISM